MSAEDTSVDKYASSSLLLSEILRMLSPASRVESSPYASALMSRPRVVAEILELLSPASRVKSSPYAFHAISGFSRTQRTYDRRLRPRSRQVDSVGLLSPPIGVGGRLLNAHAFSCNLSH